MYNNEFHSSGNFESGGPSNQPIETNDYHVHEDPWQPSSSWQPPQQPPRKKKKGTGGKFVALALCCALLGGVAGGSGVWYLTQRQGTTIYESTHEPVSVDTTSVSSGEAMTPAQLYANYVDACVGISTQVTTNVYGYQVQGAAAGSGFVVTSDGYIVTNYHVIENATSITVNFVDGTSYDATLVGGEAENDVAVLKIEATGLHAVTLGDSDALVVGEPVYTIGNPLGELTWSLTDGLVSAKDRTVTTSEGETMNMLQTNTAINPGNSGGPLFNAYGEVIGITSAKLSNNSSSSEATIEGLGFAIPINDVKDIITDLIEHGYVTGRPNLGILTTDVSSAATRYGVPAGSFVEAVLDGSCADNGGLQQGDIITAIDGTEAADTNTLKALLREHTAGDTVTLSVYRSGETIELQITLDEDNEARQSALSDLQTQLNQERQNARDQGQESSGNYFNWPFGY